MDKVPKKEVEERPAKDQRQKAEEKTFQFRLNSETFSVACDGSMTVLDALNTSQIFKNEKEKHTNRDKAVLIQRSKEMPRAAVKTDFPCCLIDDDEIIEVTFIKNDEDASKQRNITGRHSSHSNPKMFVTFCVAKKGGEKVNVLLKSKALRVKVEYVCVYARREETLKRALKRDGRFRKIIFNKHCALSEFGTESKYEMSHPVKHLDQKVFKVVVLSNAIQPDSLEEWISQVYTEPDVASDAQMAVDVGINQISVNNEQETKHNKKSTGSSAKRPPPKVIPNSEEILGILRDQFKGLLEKLKERENLKNKPQVQNFFREEFAKSVENFLEVKNVKILAKLSDSVCQIRVEGKPEGTGFLLFGRFILTNAHVIEPFAGYIQEQHYLLKTVTAVFNFEDHQSRVTELSVNADIFAAALGRDSEGRHLDYALLELNNDPPAHLPKLLYYHSFAPPRAGSQICIVGHPGEGVKKVDPCFIIGKKNEQEPIDDHFHVITQQYLEKVEENQIPYHTCFFHGSSGSPVFDEHCYLVGIHTGDFNHKDLFGRERREIEYAYSLKPILDDIKIQVENKEVSKRNYILQILEDHKDISDMETAEHQILTV